MGVVGEIISHEIETLLEILRPQNMMFLIVPPIPSVEALSGPPWTAFLSSGEGDWERLGERVWERVTERERY